MWLASHNPSCRDSAAIWDSPNSSATPHAGTDVDKAIAYGAALRADEMPRYLQHRHTLGQAQDLGIEVKVPLRPAIAGSDSRLSEMALVFAARRPREPALGHWHR
jgi:hypothetical protein